MLERIKNNRFWLGWKKYIASMKGMTLQEKVKHTWFGYKLELGTVAVMLFILITVITSVINANTKILLAGDVMNVEMTDQGFNYISTDYFESLGVPSFMNKVQVVKSYYSNSEDGDYEYNYTISNQTIALVAAESLDFQIINLKAMEMFFNEGIYLDLREFMTEEELAQWEGKIIYLEHPETLERVPVALDISDTGFVKDNVYGKDSTFFAVIKTTPRLKETRAFFEYLLAWEYQGIEPTYEPLW